MNYRNDIIMDADARNAYLANVRKNAAKHGLFITVIIGEAAGMNEIFSAIDTEFCKNQRQADTKHLINRIHDAIEAADNPTETVCRCSQCKRVIDPEEHTHIVNEKWVCDDCFWLLAKDMEDPVDMREIMTDTRYASH